MRVGLKDPVVPVRAPPAWTISSITLEALRVILLREAAL